MTPPSQQVKNNSTNLCFSFVIIRLETISSIQSLLRHIDKQFTSLNPPNCPPAFFYTPEVRWTYTEILDCEQCDGLALGW